MNDLGTDTSPAWTARKKQTNTKLMSATDPAEALRLHNEVAALTTQLAEAEERWCELQAEVMEEE